MSAVVRVDFGPRGEGGIAGECARGGVIGSPRVMIALEKWLAGSLPRMYGSGCNIHSAARSKAMPASCLGLVPWL